MGITGWILLIVGLGGIVLVWWLSRPIGVSRDPGREGVQDMEASRAYGRITRWPIFWFERRIILQRLARLRPHGILLDAGCGPAHVTRAVSIGYPQLQVIGLDINQEMLNIACRYSDGNLPQLVFGDVKQLPFADGSIDCVISSLSLHHWSDARLACKEINRILKASGQFFIFDLRRDSPRLVYTVLGIGQALFAPAAIKRTNGAVGSLYSSYTAPELRDNLTGVFGELQVETGFAWLMASGKKGQLFKEPY